MIYLPRFACEKRPRGLVPPSPPAEFSRSRSRTIRRELTTYTGKMIEPALPHWRRSLAAMGFECTGPINSGVIGGGHAMIDAGFIRFAAPGNPLSSLADAVAYWKGDDTSDATGHGNTLTAVNSPTHNTGKLGNALYTTQNGGTKKYWTAADSSYLQMGSGVDFTIACWVYTPSAVSAGHQSVILDRGAFATSDTYYFYLNGGLTIFGVGHSDSGGDSDEIQVSDVPSAATWTHYIHTCHPGAVGGESFLYKNNSQIGSNSGNIAYGGTAALTLHFGHRGDDSSFPDTDARIDSVGIWKRIITSTERGLLYNSGTGADPY